MKMRTIRELQTIAAERAKNEWNRANQSLLAITNPSDNDELWKKISAVFMIDTEKNADFVFYSKGIDQPNAYAAGVARDSLVEFMRKAADAAFIKLQRRHQIYLTVKPEGDALVQLEDMEISAGIRQPRVVPPPPPVPKTEAQLLEEEVLLDYNGSKEEPVRPPLGTKMMQEKMRTRREYRDTFYKLSETNQLQSSVTQSHDMGEVGR
jgi:hypothetical protein